jgi:hypothetical protein
MGLWPDVAPKQFKPASFAASQATSTCYSMPEPAAIHTSEPQAPRFGILLVSGGLPPHRAQRPSANHQAPCGIVPTAPSKSGNPALLLSGSLPFCGCQDTCFPKTQKGPVLLTVPAYERDPTSPLKTKSAKFPTQGRKAVTYYSVSGTRRPASWGAQRPTTPHCAWQLESPCLPAGEPCLSCPGAGNPAPPLSSNPLLCSARRLTSHSAQRPRTPLCDCRRVLVPQSRSGTSSPLAERRKEVICTSIRTLKGVTFPA